MSLFIKKVFINDNVKIIFIPNLDELLEENDQDQIWYNDDQIEICRKEAIQEIKEYASLKNISFYEAKIKIYNTS